MKIRFTLNGTARTLDCRAGDNVQELLYGLGMHSVRNCDDGYGFAGSDSILFNGVVVNASLLIAAQLEGSMVLTSESLSEWNKLSVVQQAMIDVGAVQGGYNDPATALVITDLFERHSAPTREQVEDALSGVYNRDAGYQQLFEVVELVRERLNGDSNKVATAPSFREDLVYVGKAHPKLDAAKIMKAKPCYVEDGLPENTAILKMLRSPHPHALIKRLDVSKAEKLPGVIHIITHLNCPNVIYTPGGQNAPEPSPLDRRMFSKKLRHVGDRVAGVVAESEKIALQAISLIEVEYEVLKPVMSIAEAAAPGAPIVHDEPIEYVVGAPEDLAEQNKNSAADRDEKVVFNFPLHGRPHENLVCHVHGHLGDTESGFAKADAIIEGTYTSTQVQQAPNEPHVAHTYMDGDRVVVRASTQVPWHLRRHVARILGLKQNKVHVIKQRVGGGFGSKQDMLLEEVCAWATYVTGRSVYFRYTREEEFIACSSRHVAEVDIKIGATKDGKLTAIDMRLRANTGPYGNHAMTVPCNGPSLSLPLYPCDNVTFDVKTYYSNICPTGAFQGYGAPKGNFALTMAIAELADKLGIDQLDMVEINRVKEGQTLPILAKVSEGKVPAEIPSAASCALEPILKKGRELIEWDKPLPPQGDWHFGRGVSIIQQKSGIPDIDQANCLVKLESDGTFIVLSGGADLGTGLDTAVAKIAAEVLNVPIDNVHVISGDTDHTVYDKGAYASSGTNFSGNAAKLAAEDLRAQIVHHGAKMLGEPESDVQLVAPGIIKGKKGEVTLAKFAHKGESGTGFGILVGKGCFMTNKLSFPYGGNFAEVAVNVRTGEVRLDKFYALLDCGTPINPELALGQIYGASLRAIGHTLYEEIVYDANGIPLNRDFASYGVPMIGDLPRVFEAYLVPSDDKIGPYGAKSIGELCVNGASPAIAAAIHDACGIWLREWHFTPEKVLTALGKL